jgi:hypothetical protein
MTPREPSTPVTTLHVETRVEGRWLQLLVRLPRRLAFVFVEGAPVGRAVIDPDDRAVSFDSATAARLDRASLDPIGAARAAGEAIWSEVRAREAFDHPDTSNDAARRLAAAHEARARWAILACEGTSEEERELAERVQARIAELTLRLR